MHSCKPSRFNSSHLALAFEKERQEQMLLGKESMISLSIAFFTNRALAHQRSVRRAALVGERRPRSVTAELRIAPRVEQNRSLSTPAVALVGSSCIPQACAGPLQHQRERTVFFFPPYSGFYSEFCRGLAGKDDPIWKFRKSRQVPA